MRTADSSALRIHLSTEVTGHKPRTPTHDPRYRVDAARRQTGYDQPGSCPASDVEWARVPR
ncbi:hypothetical protein ACIGNX_10165 [Actinosynnema sp. NPDC053489]|uniref:rhamnogalacturonan lyase family protein n=1 Tax=Actinosynnema sp. NPDC053489 TaxID=3363916 RepID=UPI0037C8684C